MADEGGRVPCADGDHDWVFGREVVRAFGEVVRDLPTATCSRCGEQGTITYERESS